MDAAPRQGLVAPFFFAGKESGAELYARMCAPALGIEDDPATGSACAALVGVMAAEPEFSGESFQLSVQQGVAMGRRSDINASARKSNGALTSISVGGATTYVAAGKEIARLLTDQRRGGDLA